MFSSWLHLFHESTRQEYRLPAHKVSYFALMFNEQGCRNLGPVAIAPHHFQVRIVRFGSSHDIAAIIWRRRLTVQTKPAAVRQVAQVNTIAALFRRHFFRFIPVCNAINPVVWNHLKRGFFLLHPVPVLHIQELNPSASASIP
jgi:hypothetical protein